MASYMYMPEDVIYKMLDRSDTRLREIPFYLSRTICYQKSNVNLYQQIFFDLDYQYIHWKHYFDNKYADGYVPRRLGIQTSVHDIDDFKKFENSIINTMDKYNCYPSYQIATKMHSYRIQIIQENRFGNIIFETKYYNYGYVK